MEPEQRIYKPLSNYELEEAKAILKYGTWDDLMTLPLAVGQNLEDWRAAQQVCISLLKHHDAAIRANAALGLAYIARTKGKLDKRIVKPYLFKELRENEEYRWRIVDAIGSINRYLGWKLADKALEKFRETGDGRIMP